MDKAFFTNITRTYKKSNDDLYELIKVDPATPVPVNPVKFHSCDFQPRNDKQYIPKKKNKLKVKTVRDIRNLYEKDVMSELPVELEKLQNVLLRKIKSGTSKDDKTKTLASNIFNSNKPMTRSTWQMLMNINPADHTHSTQYVLWNGKPIRVNGSSGGKHKFICNYDVGKKREPLKHVSLKKVNSKKFLLRNSLAVNFKPGPLTRKIYLDKSYQKYHVGNIEVVKLPRPGLEIQPLYGSALDPTICNFVNSLREENGTITEKWAEFAVSVIGSLKGPNIRQLSVNNYVTFNLNYQHDQTRLLMRRNQENRDDLNKHNVSSDLALNDDKEVRVIMNRILDAVEINLIQDDLFMEDDEMRDDLRNDTIQNNNKEKLKRKYCELDRLAVTVIRLSEDTPVSDDKKCHNSYCVLGCVCSSLQSTINLKGHCGRVECMFKCLCDFSEHKWIEGLDNNCSNILPGLLNLNKKINCNLSKEEQKFHQTVILTGDKSILLKSKKRNTKSSKKYAEFYSSLCSKPESKTKPAVLAVIVPRLNCVNIEPFCMVHNLYKCFCKGRFIESIITKERELTPSFSIETVKVLENADQYEDNNYDDQGQNRKEKDIDCVSNRHNTRTRRETFKKDIDRQPIVTIDLDDENDSCSRVKSYDGRKYSNGYYKHANSKILNMEINDASLRKKLLHLVGRSIKDTSHSNMSANVLLKANTAPENDNEEYQEQKDNTPQISNTKSFGSPNTSKLKSDAVQETAVIDSSPEETPINTSQLKMIDSLTTKRLLNKPKLVAWLESSYQQYKRRLDLGNFKATLEAPQKGKVALYPWDFILSRYSERKNLFLVSKNPPYRIFMAVSATNPLFESCINIDDIRFADLNKYPTSVKNLLTSTNDLKDYFCILFGLSHCWEFIGSVTKVADQKDLKHSEDEPMETDMTQEADKIPGYESDSQLLTIEDINRLAVKNCNETPELQNSDKATERLKSESSKWFIMTIENDFTEIQFYNRGFFVKYASIMQAINVARTSRKTVRLSSQKLADNNGPQFGIYAVPSANDYCVFVGPYEIDEPLGIETVKSSVLRKAKRTRGVWITTGKVDNIKVIDNPLSFIPTKRCMIPLESDSVRSKIDDIGETTTANNQSNVTDSQSGENKNDKIKTKEIIKIVKPIKIRKANAFYHLQKKSLLKPFITKQSINQLNKEPEPYNEDVTEIAAALDAMPIIIAGCDTLNTSDTIGPLTSNSRVANIQVLKQARPVAEVAPQIKIADVYSESSVEKPVAEVTPQIKIAAVYSEASPEKHVEVRKKEGCMFILKPEEINKRIENKLSSAATIYNENYEKTMDVEYFLDNSDVCPAPINLFSDGDNVTEDTNKKVFIECTNIDMGVIHGIVNKTNLLSFVFPGFKASDFYEPDVAFTKINQVLSRKVYMPKDIRLEWHIVDSVSKLKKSRLLKSDDFNHKVILTERGLETIHVEKYSNIKTYSKKDRSSQSSQPETLSDQMGESSQDYEKECQVVEDETLCLK